MVNLTLRISQSDITTLKADGCVSSIHRSKDMSKGQLASHVKLKGGQQVQDQLYKVYGQRQFGHGEVVMTGPGSLSSNFKQLIFVCLYCWRVGNDKTLEASIEKCLQTATQHGFTSIAIPALGMGGQSYPPFNVAKSIVTATIKFILNNPQTTIQTVHIALKDKDINSTRTFLQTTIAVLEGFQLGRGVDKTDNISLGGVQAFNGLQGTKPRNTQDIRNQTGQCQPKSPAPRGIAFSGNFKNVHFNGNAYASLSEWTIGVNANVALDLSSYVPNPIKSIVNKVRSLFST